MGLNKKKWALLIILLITVTAYLYVYIYSDITTSSLDDIDQTGAKSQKVPTTANETPQLLSNHETITEGNLSYPTKGVEITSEKINIENLKKTNLKLRLWGTITGSNIRVRAIIEEISNRKQKLYSEGDAVQNATITKISRKKVVLSVDDKYEILEIETKASDVNAKDKFGVTALIDASLEGQKEIVELLIVEGADLDAQDNKGDTALMNAALKGHSEIVELLIANGADVRIKDNSGNTALIDSAKYARASACQIITILIDNGANVNAKNKYGVAALMYAALGGQAENVECLIVEGADVNAKSKSGETALKFAEQSNHKDIIKLLKNHGTIE